VVSVIRSAAPPRRPDCRWRTKSTITDLIAHPA
jgi:hypothetical protein